ncbi:MAG TPA: hypothetical protein VHA57_02330 [Actinomycetota bacterium]|nr:hypothetical protein [Actinomycetota bacterium]
MEAVVVYGPPVAGAGRVVAGLLWLGLFVVFVALIAWGVTGLVEHRHPATEPGAMAMAPPSGVDEALVAARARYAGGEIDREQYFQVVEDLTGVPRPAGFTQPGAGPAAGGAEGPGAGGAAGNQ